MSDNKNDLINQVKLLKDATKSLACPDYPKKGIYSNSYFKKILSKCFLNSEDRFALLYGDFDGLNTINNEKGFKVGDNCINDALNIIKSSLPKRALISRIGGDEFLIIIPDATKEDAQNYKDLINEALDRISEDIENLTITLAATDNNFGNIEEILALAEAEVCKEKLSNKSNELEKLLLSPLLDNEFNESKRI